jgi:4-aminobutyrate aminotransferase
MSKFIHTKGESNTADARAVWAKHSIGPKSALLIVRDSNAFLHQSLSSPCAATIAEAEGIWIEDLDGNRFMDFHGNSVHHIAMPTLA